MGRKRKKRHHEYDHHHHHHASNPAPQSIPLPHCFDSSLLLLSFPAARRWWQTSYCGCCCSGERKREQRSTNHDHEHHHNHHHHHHHQASRLASLRNQPLFLPASASRWLAFFLPATRSAVLMVRGAHGSAEIGLPLFFCSGGWCCFI